MKNKLIYSVYYLNIATFISSLIYCALHFLSVDKLSFLLACGALAVGSVHVFRCFKNKSLLIRTLNHNNFLLLLMLFAFILLFLGIHEIGIKLLMGNGFVSVLLNLINGSSHLPERL